MIVPLVPRRIYIVFQAKRCTCICGGVNNMELKHVMVLLLLALPTAYAQPASISGQLLSNAFAHVECKTSFETGIVNLLTTSTSSANSLTTYATTLQNDQQKLQTDANNADVSSWKNDVAAYDSDVRSLNGAIVSWRLEGGKNLTLSSRQTIKSGDTSTRTTLASCEFSALQGYANTKLAWYNSDLSAAQARAANLSAKGVDTTALDSVISSAQSTIVTPFQSAIQSATDAKDLQAALQQYCLYDGCKSGTNFHFAAQWDIAKTSAIETYLQGQPKAGNFTSQFSQVTSDVSQSQSALSTVGTSAYGSGQSDSVFKPLQDAASVLKQIVAGMR